MRPWKTLQYVNNNGGLKGGDCVHAAPGTYRQAGSLLLTKGGNENRPTGYVTYIGAPNHASRITGSSNLFLITLMASYIIIDGFNIDGTGTADAAIANYAEDGGDAHHLKILNNIIHDSGGGGVGLVRTDYFTVSGNIIYNTSGKSPWQESGISVWEPHQIKGFNATLPADSDPVHIVISNNILYNNKETAAIKGLHTDGNGIIIDDWWDTQTSPHQPYPHKGLVQGNLCYNNGGKGIHVYYSSNVTVANNTVYNNSLDTQNNGTWRGELSNVCSNNVTWINNVSWAVPAPSHPILKFNTAMIEAGSGCPTDNVVWKNNITFNGTPGQPSLHFFNAVDGAAKERNFLAANKAGMNPLLSNFKPLSNSPVIGSGMPTPDFPPRSLDGNLMPVPPNLGAY